MANKTRELILGAFITLARRNPQRTSFTMTEIAAEAGISRQAIYQKHFNNFEDIIDYIHKESVPCTILKPPLVGGSFYARNILSGY